MIPRLWSIKQNRTIHDQDCVRSFAIRTSVISWSKFIWCGKANGKPSPPRKMDS